jgi:PAS domain S-box-containing protein
VKRSSEHTEYLNSEGPGSQLERVRSALAVDINAESWLETLLSTVPDLVYLIDAEGRWEFVNESALALYELQGIDYRGKTLPQLAELAPAYKEAFAACQRSDDSAWARRTLTRTEEKIVQTDGNELMIDLIRVPLFHDDGSRKAMVIVGRDMTEVRFAESAQRESDARLRALIDGSPYGIYQSTLQGVLLSANNAFAAMLGYSSPAEIIGCNIQHTFYCDEAERTRLLELWDVSDPNAPVEARWRRKDGSEINVRIRCRTVRDRDGNIRWFEGFAEDVTEQRRLEERLLQAQKMEAIGQLAGGIAHDFNNLLTLMMGNVSMMLRTLCPEDPLHRNASDVMRAAERARELTRQLLAFSRKQVLAPRVVDLNAVIAEISGMLPRLLGEDVDLTVDFSPEPTRVKADPVQVQQVVMNLATNARDAMPNGGKLNITVGQVQLKREDDSYEPALLASRYGTLQISDTGCGISEDVKKHIFEPFFTTKEPGKGTGLGLATVYGIVEQSNGHITVHSEQGHGTTFRVFLPLTMEEPVVVSFGTPSGEVPKGTETILLVEDEEGIRTMMRLFLKQKGYDVLDARTGDEALKISAEYEGAIHLLITDVVMPGIRGTELADQLCKQRSELKVLMMSGYSPVDLKQHSVHMLEKPFAMEDFGHRVRRVIDSAARGGAA